MINNKTATTTTYADAAAVPTSRTESVFCAGDKSLDSVTAATPIYRIQSTPTVLDIAVEYDLECWQFDFDTPFLNAELKEEFYVKLAPGYEEPDASGAPVVIQLHKSFIDSVKVETAGGVQSTHTRWRLG